MHEGTDPLAEYEAVRTGAGIWDLFSTSKYEVTGPERSAADPAPIHQLVGRRAHGAVRYGAFVNADGRWWTTATSTSSPTSGTGS